MLCQKIRKGEEVIMQKRQMKRIAALSVAAMMTLQCFTVNASEQMNVRTQSATQMSSDKEVVYVNTYDASKREQNFDANWKFYLGDASGAESATFDDSAWRSVNLPHDYSIEQEYTKAGEAESGYLLGGTGWYRKHFTLKEDMRGKEIRIDFGGVYMNATVWVNGTQLGTHPYGYTPFSFDITDYVRFDQENVITVKVDHKTPSSRWYSGSGIYRSVNLTVMDKVHVDLYGTLVSTPNLASEAGKEVTMNIATTVANADAENKEVVLVHSLYEKGSTDVVATVTTNAATVEAGKTAKIDAVMKVNNPKLWGIGEANAHLYTVTTEVKVGDAVVDAYDTEYGFRYTSYDTKTGFYLNGQPVKLQGVCMHHDQGSLGSEAHYRAIERQVEILQEMGCNSIRVTHNPAADALIEICNAKGMLVIDEVFDGWHRSKNGNSNDYAKWFAKAIEEGNEIIGATDGMTWAQFDLRATINRGKNAPSIIMWSLGNEIQEGAGGDGYAENATRLIAWAKELYNQEGDDARVLTIGSNAVKSGNTEQINVANQITAAGGASGTNYSNGSSYDSLHSQYPDWYLYGSETASHVNSRGVYKVLGSQSYDGNYGLTSYDYSAVGWGATASSAWYDVITRDFVFGEYVWTGFDYMGEPTPSNGTGSGAVGTWPSPKNSYFGIIDTAGLPKDNYYFYQSQWNDEVNTLHVLPAWNKDVVVSGNVPIVVYSDAAAVELFFTGTDGVRTSLGKKTFTEHKTGNGFTYQMYEGEGAYTGGNVHRNMYLTWNKAFEEGTIEAVAYDKNGAVITDTVGRSSVTTTGEEAKLQAKVDRATITADGRDLAYITVDVTDADGNIVPDAANNVKFTVEGDGVLVGVDNGKQSDHQSFQDDNRNAYNGSLIAIVQSTKDEGSFTVKATSTGLKAASVTVTTVAADEDASAAVEVDSFFMAKNYYVKTGNKVVLPETIETRYTNGTSEELPVEWDKITETEGTFGVNGVVEGKYSVSVVVNMIDEMAGLLNYSTTTSIGQAPVLPDARPAVLVDGEILNVSFPVTWEDVDADAYAEAGTFVVNGAANVLGQAIDVTATVRVQEETITIVGSVDDPHTLTQDIPADKQSDSLEAVWDDSTTGNKWTNYTSSQEGDNTASIIFEYATEQRVGDITIHFFKDGYSASYPDAGTTEIYVSGTGADDSWKKLEAKETIGEEANNVIAYEYDFAPVGATFVKFNFTNKDEVLSSGVKPCTGITEIEIKKAVGSFVTNSTAELAEVKVGETALTEAQIAKGVYYTLETDVTVTAAGKDNAAVTVLPAYENNVLIYVESEDHMTRETFVVKLGQEAPIEPSDSSKDYPREKTTATAGSEQQGQASEGLASMAVDNNTSTHYHSSWNPKASDDQLWIQLELEEVTALTALRYLPRTGPNNGTVTEYEISYSVDGKEWKVISTGNWDVDKEWKLAQFDKVVEAKYVKLFAVDSVADSGGRHLSAAEIRLVTAGGATTPDQPDQPDTPDATDDSRDIPVNVLKGSEGSAETSSATEGAAALALDGKTDTMWHSKWAGDDRANLWIQFELAEDYNVDGLRYLPRTNAGGKDAFGTITEYKVQVSADGEDWDDVATGNWANDPEWKITTFDANRAKFVRLVAVASESDSRQFASAAEIRLTGEKYVEKLDPTDDSRDIPVNVLKGSEGSAETSSATEGAAALALDGKTDTMWHSKWAGDDRANLWIQFELTEDYNVDGLRYLPRTNAGGQDAFGTITEYKVQVSADGEDWEDVATGNWANDPEWKIAKFDANQAKFVRLVAVASESDHRQFASAAEIRLTGTKVTGGEEPDQPTVNKDALEAAVTAAEAKKEADYTPNSWTAFADALKAAKAALAAEDATQATVDAAVAALNDASGKLAARADVTALTKAITDAKALKEADYTPKSWEALENAVKDAEMIKADANASQSAVDLAKKAVEDAVAALVQKADKTALTEKVEDVAELREADYTAESWAVLEAALEAANAVLANDNATDKDVADAVAAVAAAVEGLKAADKPVDPDQPGEPEDPEVVDKTILEDYVEECVAYYKEANYTADSWAVYAAALADAEAVLANQDATKEDVVAAVNALADAAEALVKVEAPGEEPGESGKEPEKPEGDDKDETESPSTGDSAMVVPMVVFMAACAAVVVAILRKRFAK